MNLLFPLGMAALGALVPLVALYLLKQKRVDTPVPAAFLWTRAIEDLRASSLFQRIRTPLLFFLQAASIVLCALAAAGASLDLDIGSEPRRVIVVVDRSRSMGVADETGGATRMEVARALCLDAVSGLHASDEMMLVAFDAEAEVLVAFTSDEELLTKAVERLAPRDLPSRPADALRLAASFAKASPGFVPEVVVVSDGAVTGDLPLISCEVTFARLGTTDANQGIVDARLASTPGERPEVFVRVRNAGKEPMARSLVLRRAGEIVDARRLACDGGADVVAFFELEDPEGDEPVLLDVALEGRDALPADDHVALVLRPAVPRAGLLVREQPTLHLDAEKLSALHPGLVVTAVRPDEARATFDAGVAIDLVVWDGVAPETLPPVAAQIFVGALPPGSGLVRTGSQEFPTIIDWERTHPTTARCQFDDIVIEEAPLLRGVERSLALVDTTGGPVVLLTPVPGREVLVVAFDPARSNLPLKLAWPLFLANSLDYLLAGVRREGEEPVQPTGVTLRTADGGPFEVTRPDGVKVASAPAQDGRHVVRATDAAGVYVLAAEGAAPVPHALALLDESEVAIAPATELVLGGDRVEASPAVLRRNVLLRDPLLLACLGILLLEWALWCSRR